MIFQESDPYLQNVAQAFPKGGGYAGFLHGKVVDMLYFPLLQMPVIRLVSLWGGDEFEFFRPVFNIADASISVGVIAILIFQNKFFKKHEEQMQTANKEIEVEDKMQMVE